MRHAFASPRDSGRFRPTLLLVVLAALAGGCGSGVTDPEGPARPDAAGPPPPQDPLPREVLPNPSFSENIQEIFVRKGCGTVLCHGSGGGADLDLRASVAWNQLVGAPSTQESGTRVIPFDPVNSYLMRKVEGRQTVGSRMPIGRPALDSIDLANLRNWIHNGARNN